MNRSITIAPLTPGRIPDVVAIERALFSSPWSEGMFEQEVENNYLSHPVIALLGDEVVGYLIPWILQHEVHLLNIGVAPRHQRKGYGKRLLEYLIERSREKRRDLITLEVRRSNAIARQLYESYGFRNVAVRRRYYDDTGEDAIVMVLLLDGGEVGQ